MWISTSLLSFEALTLFLFNSSKSLSVIQQVGSNPLPCQVLQETLGDGEVRQSQCLPSSRKHQAHVCRTYGGREGRWEGHWQAWSDHPRLGLLMRGCRLGDTGYAWGRAPTSPRLPIPPFSLSPPLSRKHSFPTLLPGFPPSTLHFHVTRSRACLLRVWETPRPPSCFLQLGGREMVSVTVSHVPLAQKTLVSGVLPISPGLYLLHHLPGFFFFFSNGTPLLSSLAV